MRPSSPPRPEAHTHHHPLLRPSPSPSVNWQKLSLIASEQSNSQQKEILSGEDNGRKNGRKELRTVKTTVPSFGWVKACAFLWMTYIYN